MPIAISLRLDSFSADRITSLWRHLAEAGITQGEGEPDYRPHITLGLYEDLDVAEAKVRLDDFVVDKPIMTAGFSGLGVFPGERNILWATPDPDLRLLSFHAGLHEALAVATHPHYRVGKWVPHCTLAGSLNQKSLIRALSKLLPLWKPFMGWFDHIDLVRFEPLEPPVEVLWSRGLAEDTSLKRDGLKRDQ